MFPAPTTQILFKFISILPSFEYGTDESGSFPVFSIGKQSTESANSYYQAFLLSISFEIQIFSGIEVSAILVDYCRKIFYEVPINRHFWHLDFRKGWLMKTEKRKRSRVSISFDVTISIGQKDVMVEALNVSLKGIFCTSNPSFKKNEECLVKMNLGENAGIVCNGKILRTAEEGTAIAFTSIDEESFFHLKKLIQFHSDDADEIEAELLKPAFEL
jgi:hypothetical protein